MNAPGWHRDRHGALDLRGYTGLRVAYIMPCQCAEAAAVAWGLDGWIFDDAEHGHADSEEGGQARIVAALRARGIVTTAALAEAPLPGGAS